MVRTCEAGQQTFPQRFACFFAGRRPWLGVPAAAWVCFAPAGMFHPEDCFAKPPAPESGG